MVGRLRGFALAMLLTAPKWDFNKYQADLFQGDIWGVSEHFHVGCNVLDIGANRGLFTAFCGVNGAHITAYEPHPEAYKSLVRTIQLNGIENQVSAIEAAVWIYSGTTKLDISTTPYANSTISDGISNRNNYPEENVLGYEVPCITLSDAIANNKWDIVKMDIEGAEFPVLLNCPDLVLSHIKFLTVELHHKNDVVGVEYTQLLEKLQKTFDLQKTEGWAVFATQK